MIKHTIGQQKVLQELQNYYQYAANNDVRKKWFEQHIESLRVYYGEQWDKKMREDIERLGGIPLVINRVEPIITNYVSLQINNRKRIAFKPSTNIQRHATLAEYLNNMLYNIQTQNDFQHYSTQKYTDSCIGGLGWTYFGYDNNAQNTFFYDYVDPREVYWDPDDNSTRLENSNFVCRTYYVQVNLLKERYPKFAEYFDDLTSDPKNQTSPSNDMSYYTTDEPHNTWVRGRSVRIVEVYYKKEAKYYEGTVVFNNDQTLSEEVIENQVEQYFCTFDQEYAESIKEPGTELKELQGTQIWKGVYCCDALLESGALYPQIPNQKYFPLVPLVLRRNYFGMPYGLVGGLSDISKALNYVWSKAIHGLDAKHLICEKDHSFDMSKDGEAFLNEMSKKRGIIALKNAKDAQFFTSEGILPFLFQSLQRIDIEFEQRTQLFDELKGNQTNAVSGVAIQQRTINSARNQNPLSSTYDHMLISEGKLMLDTIKGITDFRYAFNYYKDGKVNYGTLDNEISSINFEIYSDIAPNYSSSNDERIARFEALLASPNPALVLSSPVLLKSWGIPDNEAQALNAAFLAVTQGGQQEGQPPEEQLPPQAITQ